MKLRNDYKELKAQRANLVKKRESVLKKREANENDMVSLIAKAKQSEKELLTAEKKCLRDELSKDGLHEVRKNNKDGLAALEEAEKIRDLSYHVMNEIDHEIRGIDQKIKIALSKICNEIRNDLESKFDPNEIQKKLIELHVSKVITDGGNADWLRMIMAYFPMPDTEEVKSALKEFTTNNKI